MSTLSVASVPVLYGSGDPDDNRGGESCVPMLALLLSAGADPNQRFEDGKTPLMYAVRMFFFFHFSPRMSSASWVFSFCSFVNRHFISLAVMSSILAELFACTAAEPIRRVLVCV